MRLVSLDNKIVLLRQSIRSIKKNFNLKVKSCKVDFVDIFENLDFRINIIIKVLLKRN